MRAVWKCFLISAVARVYEPGCKADHVPIIEGPQGIWKSSAVEALASPWFTDELADLGSKDAAMQTHAAWIIEVAELDSMGKPEVSKIKAFISRTVDRFRPPYGRRVIEAPRQCVFVGTTNSSEYLKDATGARRFWPVKAGKIDLAAIKRDRDQLWAEAVTLHKEGVVWWPDANTTRLAEVEQAARLVPHPWLENIEKHIEGKDETSVADILLACVGKEMDKWTQATRTPSPDA